MNLFVTGGTGFLGSHFIAAALADGHQIMAIRRSESSPRIKLKQEPTWCCGNLDDDWRECLQKCDIFVHLASAGVVSNKDNWEYCFRVNVTESLALWRQAIDSGVRKFLICGTCFEYGLSGNQYEFIPTDAPLLPIDAYSSSKAAASLAAIAMAHRFDIKLLLVRPFHLYGLGESQERFWPSLCQAARSGLDFPMTQGEQIRDFMHVTDASSVLLDWSLQLPHSPVNVEIRNLGSGKLMKLIDFAQQEWSRLKATGCLKPGQLDYREGEIMRYAPLLD